MHALPIMGLFYRWGVDLAGPFATSRRGNKYVMVCIEHFSKFAVLVPLLAKTAEETAYALATHVLGPYGGCGEIITDQGNEFKGEFQELLTQALIDHRTTSPDHPQADGLAERCVNTMKKALTKLCLEAGSKDIWDMLLPWVSLGYNCSPQMSTKLSPHELLFARRPAMPAAVKDQLSCPSPSPQSTRRLYSPRWWAISAGELSGCSRLCLSLGKI
jgi:hypothetical protein